MNTTWCNGRESTGCEQAPPRSTVVSVQQHMAFHDTAVITFPPILLCGKGGPRSPSLLQGKLSSKGMGLWRYVQYHLPKQELPLHVVIGSPRQRSAANTQLVHPHRLRTSSFTTSCTTPREGYAELMALPSSPVSRSCYVYCSLAL